MTDITFKSYGICVDSYPKETYGEIDDYALAEQEKLRALHKQTDGDVSTSPFNEHLVSFLEPGGVSRWAHS